MAKWEDFSESKEFKLWFHLKEMSKLFELNESKLIDYHDYNDYLEPFLEKVFRLGLQFKQTAKLKEIKMDWIRPIFFCGVEEKITIDGKIYYADKECIYKAQEIRRNLGYLLNAILDYDKCDSTNFKKMKKTLQDCSSAFFKNLIIFVTKNQFLLINKLVKQILRPLLDLRKANYHLFNLEKKEQGDQEITIFEDKKDFKIFTETITQFFQDEEIKMKRDCDMEAFEDFLNKNNSKSYYQYNFAGKQRDGYSFTGNTQTQKMILQRKFEEGIISFLKYLYDKKPDDFYIEIDVHKLFTNLEIPKVNELKPLKYYTSNMHNLIKEYKEKLYEMKINGLTRIKMPLTENIEIIDCTKKIYDLHILIDKIMGDKLLYDQYLFTFNHLTFILDSNIKEEITIFKDKNFMEDVLPKYLIFCALRQSVNIMHKMKEQTKSENEIFSYEKFYQIEKYNLDTENNNIINAYYYTETMKKAITPELDDIIHIFLDEIEKFNGRFWILEGCFDIADKSLWLDAINILKDINTLVQDDIRDYILLNYEHSNSNNLKDGSKKDSSRDNTNHKSSSNKLNSLKTLKQKDSSYRVNSSAKGKKPQNTKRQQNFNHEKGDKSVESDEESVLRAVNKNIQINLDHFRPPYIWNFPVETLMKKYKEEDKKFEIRQVDPRNFYKDGRVKKFLEILEKIKTKMLIFSLENKNYRWRYFFECSLKIHEIAYVFSDEQKKKVEKTMENETFTN